MTELDKMAIIKEYVLKDRESFSLANDIYSVFWEIKEYLKDSIYCLLESQIKTEIPNAMIRSLKGYTNNQYIEISYHEIVTIQIQFSNYFIAPVLHIRGADDELTKKIEGVIKPTTAYNNQIHFEIKKYSFNRTVDLLSLYDLCNDDALKKDLIKNFTDHVLPYLIKLYNVIELYHKKT